jgi:hydroxyquinol 1,2-dioxygenase
VTRTAPRQPETREQQAREKAVTEQVVASFDDAASDRYRELMQSLVRHLHAFARDVRLTEDEWSTAIEFLTRVGHITDHRRQEFILLSDVLGLSMLTVGINAPATTEATESTVFGPFFLADAPKIELGDDLSFGAKGTPCYVYGQVRSTDQSPLPGARIDAWEADADGLYDTQYADDRTAARGCLHAGANGEYSFWSVLPTAYPIPHDGPVGDLITAAGRGPMRPAHLHFKVQAPGHRTLITHAFVAGDPYLDDDAVFGVKDSLVVEFTHHHGGTAPDGSTRTGEWTQAQFDLILAKEET